MSEAEELRKALETAQTNAPDGAVVTADEIVLSWRIAAWTTEAGSVTVYNVFGGTKCDASQLLDIGGSGVTGENGMVTIHLNDFHCLDGRPVAGANVLTYSYPVNVVATPRTDRPVTLSVQSRIGPGQYNTDDVLITVFSWDPNGQAAGRVDFNWRCMVPIGSAVG
jgi:hypothetical protein